MPADGRHFDNWIQSYINYIGPSEAPTVFHFWTGVAIVAGALKRRVWLDMRKFEWTPNFYIVLVAPPGIVGKTTTIDVGEEFLREIPGVFFGPKIVTWQSIVSSLAAAQESVPVPSLGSDGLDADFTPMATMSFFSGELGNLYDPTNREMTDLFISLYDAKRGIFNKATKKSGTDIIDTPCLNLIACTTPNMVSERFPPSFIQGGMASRCIFLFADKKEQYIAYPDEYAGGDMKLREQLIEDLQRIAELFGAFTLHPLARDYGRHLYTELWEGQDKHAEINTDKYAGYKARKQAHIHKLAMILSACRDDSLMITIDDLTTAHTIIDSIEPMMEHVFTFIGTRDDTRGTAEVLRLVRALKQTTRLELWNRLHLSLTVKQFQESLQGALDTQMIGVRNVGGEIRYIWQGREEVTIVSEPTTSNTDIVVSAEANTQDNETEIEPGFFDNSNMSIKI